jgi:hypothetical protein
MLNYYGMSRSSIIFFFILLITACKGGSQEQQTEQVVQAGISEGIITIDGEPLHEWEITNFGPQGPVYVSGDEIILGMGEGCTGITWTGELPLMDYRVNLEAKRVAGNDFFCALTFPVEDDPCTLIVGGWSGTVVGLSSIDGKDASENETTTYREFERNRWYDICLVVTKDSIRAFIDDEVAVDLATVGKHLSVRPEVRLSRPFGIASWYTTAAIRNINITRLFSY